ncbi:MAG: hypothetical protein RJQ04_03185 [Longimicrobiales bacterium]
MGTALVRAEQVAKRLLPALFAEMNRTGHAGHCILVSRVMGVVLEQLDVVSEPFCVDYRFENTAAVAQLGRGRRLTPPALVAQTGSGALDGYDHHVVTLVRENAHALLLDPTIIQLERHMPGISLPPIMITLPWPREAPLALDFEVGRLTYTFRHEQIDFMDNDQWTDLHDASVRARAILAQM